MRITTVNLPEELQDRIDEVARHSDRSRSSVIRILLERSLTGADRMTALDAVAAQGLREFADAGKAPRARSATELIGSKESCADGAGRLAALEKIAARRK
jgi:predicted transcriptional regulator